MDPLHFCIAIAPLSVYLLVLAILNLSGRPFVTTGARDSAALGIAVSGLVIAGPMELFFPEEAAVQFGGLVWLLLLAFYGLCVSLVVLLLKPRLVIYNIASDQLRPVLTQVALDLDRSSRWVGESLVIPKLRIHLYMVPVDWLRNVQLVAGASQQSFEGWRELELALKQELRSLRVGPNLVALPLLGLSALMALAAAGWMLADQESVARAWDEMLRR